MIQLVVLLRLVSRLYANSRFGREVRIDDIIEKLNKKITEKERKIVIKSDRGNPPVAIIETPNETYPETNIANSVLKTIFVTS
mgnify:FL=1|jgi:hypothetical protein|tara:strand:+ start:420 stop:668 length:249 start_codon:yes stop_codon:yes gene_type:complete